MSFQRTPHESGSWSTRTIVGAVLTAPLIALAVGLARVDPWQALGQASGLMLAAALIGSGLLFYVQWLLTKWSSCGWLVLATLTLGSYLALTHVLALARFPAAPASGAGELAEPVAFGVLLLVLAVIAPGGIRAGSSVHPALAGILGGSGMAVVVDLLRARGIAGTPDDTFGLVVVVAILVSGILVTWSILTRLGMPTWVRTRLALAVTLAGAAQAGAIAGGSTVIVASAVAESVAALMLLDCALVVAYSSIHDLRRALQSSRGSLERQESQVRAERATLHEVRATLSGIAQAFPMTQSSDVPTSRRDQLHDMIASELGRLERMVDGSDEHREAAIVDLDRVLDPIVLRQRVRGQIVHWQPSGHTALVDEDSLAEIFSLLLENARRHAPGATTVVEVVPGHEDHVYVVVSDTGRGVPARLRSRIFEWGVSAPTSPGQGIGLAVARELARENAGDLDLVDGSGGATFVLTVPSTPAEPMLSLDEVDWDALRSA